MKIGDLIILKPEEYPRYNREVGTVLSFDMLPTSMGMEPMVEALWNTGQSGWILSKRVEVVNESQ